MGLFDIFGGGEDEEFSYQFQDDPYVGKTQDTLFPFFSDIIAGKPNDYYAPIGNYGGKELEDMLALNTRDVTKSVNENLVRRGMSRSGLAGAAIAPAVADMSTKMRWDDYNRAMEGRKFLGTWGTSGLEGIRSAALNNQNQKNTIGYDVAKTNYSTEQANQAAEDQMWAQLLSSGIGALGNMYGMSQMGGGGSAGGGMSASSIDYSSLLNNPNTNLGLKLGRSDWWKN
jgi:hypothetical protein